MHILLVEDDEGIITSLSLYLTQSGFTVTPCRDGTLAEEKANEIKPSLIILDINLPWKNGVEVCRSIRETSKTPIIVLSARESEEDTVTLLELWADDYVSKPFSPRELVARILAIMKRAEWSRTQKSGKNISLGKINIDTKNYEAHVDGKEISLTKTEFLILLALAQNVDWLVKRETLMKEIIGYENYIYDRTIDTHIKNLRRKTEEYIEIETVRGIWYRVRAL